LRSEGAVIHSQNRREGFNITLINGTCEVLESEKIDVIHCHQYTHWVNGADALLGLRAIVIFIEHSRFYFDLSIWKRKVINDILSFFTNYITTISKATKKLLLIMDFCLPIK
jgi:hypothetical protein